MTSGERTTIVVVVGVETTRLFVTHVLAQEGYRVVATPSGREALSLVEEGPDLVVLDLSSADIDGLDLHRRIKGDSKTTTIPVLLLGATGADGALTRPGVECGADAYLTHPCEPGVLLAGVRALLRLSNAERQLRESESRHRSVLESVGDAVVVVDQQGTISLVNPAAERLFGYARNTLVGAPLATLLPPERSAAHTVHVRDFWANARARPMGAGLVLSARHRDGHEIPVEISLSPTAFGDARMVTAVVRDARERLRADAALQSIAQAMSSGVGAQFFQTLVRQICSATGADYAFVCELMPSAACMRTRAAWGDGGLRPNFSYVLAGTPCENVVLEARACAHTQGVSEMFPLDRWLADHGITGYVGVPFLNESGRVVGAVIALFRQPIADVTQVSTLLRIVAVRAAVELGREQVDDALRRAEADYRKVVENAIDGILRLTPEGTLSRVNKALANMAGYESPSDMLDTVRDAATHLFVRADAFHELRELVERHGTVGEFETSFCRRDGETIHVIVSAWIVRADGNQTTHYECFVRNVTERRELETRVAHAQRMEAVGQIAGGIAHDFNNLLTVVSGCGHLLLEDIDPASPHRGLANDIVGAAQRAASLTRQLLAFSRRQALAPEVVDINVVLSEMESMLRRVVREDVELSLALTPAIGPAYVDPRQLEQVVLNLVMNAVDAMPEGGRLTIETLDVEGVPPRHDVPAGRHAQVRVTDTGRGMSAEVLARIFEPFFTTKEAGRGTGLGLATAYGIVRQSEGFIDAVSAPGHGTTLTVSLPVTTKQRQVKQPRWERSLPIGTERVLVVEDEPALRQLICTVLERAGYDVVAAANGTEALARQVLDNQPFDLLLSDIVMPGTACRDVVKASRRRRKGLRVLLMSGYSDEIVGANAPLLQQYPFIQKPFSPSDIAHAVRNALDSRS